MKILLGADPELFVRSERTKKFVSAHDLIPGTKQEPYAVKCGAVQVDGVAAEFNINPAECEDEFVFNIATVMGRLGEMIRSCDKNFQLVASPTAVFDQDYFDSIPVEAKVLGCTPDYNAYTGEPNSPPHTNEPFRTGCFHVHVGFTNDEDPKDRSHFEICRNLAKQYDAVLFPLSHTWDADQKRRSLYGNKGAFRPKSYGLEWRPLSNAVVRSEDTIRLVYRSIFKATELYFEGVKLYE